MTSLLPCYIGYTFRLALASYFNLSLRLATLLQEVQTCSLLHLIMLGRKKLGGFFFTIFPFHAVITTFFIYIYMIEKEDEYT